MYKFHLFEALGVELEYMIVDKATLKVQPITDRLLNDFSGNDDGDFENGDVDWSNELVAHVIELKSHEPTMLSPALTQCFHQNVMQINRYLSRYDCALLPTAMHPFFDPIGETVLWQHEHSDIYELYNRVFDCRRHGWANLQSVHLNLPFLGDEEFGNLHAAIRFLLPLIPGIAASSPIVDGKPSGYKDARMWHYLGNQRKIPSLVGPFIPEPVYTEKEYFETVFSPIERDFKSLDPEGIMNPQFLNSRGAIARFDRNTIEIRVTDIQECPSADMAVAGLVTETLKELIFSGRYDLRAIKDFSSDELYALFLKSIKDAEDAVIDNFDFLRLLNLPSKPIKVGELWRFIFGRLSGLDPDSARQIRSLLQLGTLSTRIIDRYNKVNSIQDIYRQLMDCLEQNRWFE